MAGLKRIAKMYGRIVARDAKSEVTYRYDQASDDVVVDSVKDLETGKISKPKSQGS